MTTRPTDRATVAALRTVGRAVGADCAYHLDGRFYFVLSDAWALAVSRESAGRFRLDACHGLQIAATMWALAQDRARLAALAQALEAEVNALSARG